ncbi:alpha/beta fold hydrolase [Microbacterium invictum]|uniref:Pimeloyl-ACP methyl ester carboxylesterase n=1 Tax=Microbacterium invictum TaxID=515415 RepID=A0AA40VK14_9MICO|nr:alpha/beta hydrolase [Microbacterium invictum]MBB4138241.1 pimeloyl-ACP methyl ester carboxylesterase [Microbacterium invictum]
MTSTHEFAYGGATLVAERRSGGDPTFVLIHGIGMGRGVFGDLIDHLGDTADVVSIDLPGYGEAPEPERVLTMERTADLVAAYLRTHVGRPAVLVGHSMGAQIVLEVAVRHPLVVERIALLGPSGDPGARSARAQLWRLLRDVAVESPKVIVLGGREYVRAGPNLRAKLRAMLTHRPEDVLGRVTVPTLVIRGENDIVVPREWCRAIVRGVPDARLAEIAGHGHETMIRDAEPSAALLQAFAAE